MYTYPYPWDSFFSMLIPLVLVPTLIGVVLIWWPTRKEPKFSTFAPPKTAGDRPWVGWLTGGRFGLWATGLLGGVLGFLSGALWLSWSASGNDGTFVAPGLPMPGNFPVWQVIICGVSVVGAAVFASISSRRLMPGAIAAALGTAAGFSTWFAAGAAMPVTSQEGIGVMMAMVGTTFSLSIINFVVALIRAGQIKHRV